MKMATKQRPLRRWHVQGILDETDRLKDALPRLPESDRERTFSSKMLSKVD